MTNEGTTTLLQFPCQFPIKAMGRNSDDFEDLVTAIVLRHAELWLDQPVRVSPSKAGNFIAVTVVINATSQQQLDSIYQELTDSSLVLMAL